MNKKESFVEYIKADLSRICEPTLMNFLKQYFFSRGEVFPYVFWLRIVHFLRKRTLTKYTLAIPAYFILRHFQFKYGIHTNPNINIGKGIHIVHGGALYINCKSIGEHFTVYQGVTLGSNDGGIPVVKKNVSVYTGAVVCGSITLNDGCVVGANSYVSRDVEENCLVAGLPAKMLKKL